MSRTVSFRPAAEWSTEQLRPVRQNDLELAGLPRISLVEFDHGALSDEAYKRSRFSLAELNS